jgi:hypothetical protein
MAVAGLGVWLLLDRSAWDDGQQPPRAAITTRDINRPNFFMFPVFIEI